MVDDLMPTGGTTPVSRHDIRQRLDEVLTRPLDETKALEHDRERWGMGPDAIEAAQAKDALWGDLTYGEEVVA